MSDPQDLKKAVEELRNNCLLHGDCKNCLLDEVCAKYFKLAPDSWEIEDDDENN